MDNANVQEIVQREPWRTGQVWLSDVLDPTWHGAEPQCDGQIVWNVGSKWWWCDKCGYCGFWGNTRHHPVRHPFDTLVKNVALFLRKREKQGMTPTQACMQLAHAFSAVAGMMISVHPNELIRFVEKLRENL